MRLNRRTIAFLIGSLALIVVVWAILRQDAPPAPATVPSNQLEGGAQVFEDVRAVDVVSWRIRDERAGRDNRFVQGQEGWRVVETLLPAGANLSQSAIQDALATLVNASSSARFFSDDLAPFGLDTPHYSLTLTLADGTERTLQLGTLNPANTRYYGRVIAPDTPDNLVHLVNNPTQIGRVIVLAEDLPLRLPPTPAPAPVLSVPGVVFAEFRPDSAVSIEWRRGDALLTIHQQEDASWRVTQTDADEQTGDAQRIDLLLRAWGGLRATDALSITDDALGALGLDDDAYEIRVTARFNETTREYHLRVGALDASGTRYYALANVSVDVLLMPVDDLAILLNALQQPPVLPDAPMETETSPPD